MSKIKRKSKNKIRSTSKIKNTRASRGNTRIR